MKIILLFLAFVVLSVNAASTNKVTGLVRYGTVRDGLPILFMGPQPKCPQERKMMKYFHFNIVSSLSILVKSGIFSSNEFSFNLNFFFMLRLPDSNISQIVCIIGPVRMDLRR